MIRVPDLWLYSCRLSRFYRAQADAGVVEAFLGHARRGVKVSAIENLDKPRNPKLIVALVRIKSLRFVFMREIKVDEEN